MTGRFQFGLKHLFALTLLAAALAAKVAYDWRLRGIDVAVIFALVAIPASAAAFAILIGKDD